MSVRGPPNRNMSTVMSAWVATFGGVVVFVARIASGARTGIGRTDRIRRGPDAARWPECSGVVGHRSRTRPAATRDRDPTRRAGGPPESVLCASSSWKPSRPSVGSARKEEGKNPRAIGQIGTRPPGRWDHAREARRRPRSQKPVTQASRPVAHVAPSVASGRAPEILAAGPARPRLYS